MRGLIFILVLTACATPDYYTRLEDPAVASKCVSQLLGVEQPEIQPFVRYEDGPFWINYRGERRKAYGTWSRTGDVRVITIARGPRMAETMIHEFGHHFGLRIVNGHDYAEDLVRRMKECENFASV